VRPLLGEDGWVEASVIIQPGIQRPKDGEVGNVQ
jgi:hypothetical protein